MCRCTKLETAVFVESRAKGFASVSVYRHQLDTPVGDGHASEADRSSDTAVVVLLEVDVEIEVEVEIRRAPFGDLAIPWRFEVGDPRQGLQVRR